MTSSVDVLNLGSVFLTMSAFNGTSWIIGCINSLSAIEYVLPALAPPLTVNSKSVDLNNSE